MYTSIPTNPFVWQMVAEIVYMSTLDTSQYQHTQSRQPQRELSDIEKNAVRYAAGFVVRKLRRSFEKQKQDRSVLVACLNQLIYDPTDLDDPDVAAEPEVEDMDYEAYTKVWLSRTNRGGLLQVTNDTFALFWEIELVVYDLLQKLLSGQKKSVSELTLITMEDVDIQFIWSVVSNLEEEEAAAKELLSHIVREWVVLRGHSLCSCIIEKYKRAMDELKKKSLRREMKRDGEEPTE